MSLKDFVIDKRPKEEKVIVTKSGIKFTFEKGNPPSKKTMRLCKRIVKKQKAQ